MKKYKLIKKYPGVKLEVGDIVEYIIPSSGTIYQYYCVKKSIGISGVLPEDYPEFWGEVIEKEYEILSLLIRRSDKHEIRDMNGYDEDYILSLEKCDGNKIHSIKRLSDGQIFTIGDKCHLSNGNYYGFKLKEFKFITNGYQGLEKHRNKTWLKLGIVSSLHKDPVFFYLEDMIKTKIPLCKSADGVDIYEDDSVVSLDKEGWITRNQDYRFKTIDVEESYYLFFSTLEAAKEYILMNKPCLSLQDVMNSTFEVWDEKKKALNELKAVVKSKLPQS